MTTKIFAAITFAFLIGVTLAGCAQVADLRAQLVKDTADLNHKPTAVWQHTADHGGE